MYKYCIKISDAKEFAKAAELGVYNIEASFPLETYTPNELEDLRDLLIDSGMRIVLLDTVLDPEDKENIRRLFLGAHLLNVENVKITPKDTSDLSYVYAVSKAMSIPVMIENKSGTWLSDESALTKAIDGSENAGIIFNPFEFVKEKAHPFLHSFTKSHAKSRIKFLRTNDGLYTGEATIPGKGSAEIKEMASILLARNFDGYFMLTPCDENNGDEYGCAAQLSYMKRIFKLM